MSPWERSWEVDIEARAGRVQGRNHFILLTQKGLKKGLRKMSLGMFFGTLLTHMAHFGQKSCFLLIWDSFWRSLGSLGADLCAQMSSWERSWEVETKARSGRVHARNHFYFGTDNSLRSNFFLELNLPLEPIIRYEVIYSLNSTCFCTLNLEWQKQKLHCIISAEHEVHWIIPAWP